MSGDDPQTNVISWPPNEECNLHHQNCLLKYGDQSVELSVSPNSPIPVARLLDVEVKTANLSIEKAEFDIAGINMYMGYNRIQLQPTSPNHNHFSGKAMLAFCTNDIMEWQLTVLLFLKDGQVIEAPFLLTTDIN